MTKIASMLILNALARVCRHAAVETSGTCTANTLQQEFRDDYFQSLLGAGDTPIQKSIRRQHLGQRIPPIYGQNISTQFFKLCPGGLPAGMLEQTVCMLCHVSLTQGFEKK